MTIDVTGALRVNKKIAYPKIWLMQKVCFGSDLSFVIYHFSFICLFYIGKTTLYLFDSLS